jgi:superfamily II DNA or RNA helicase
MYASEGFDEKRFDTLVLASPASDIRQSVGRILRKMDDPDHAPVVIDIVDQWSVFKKQYMKRRILYRSMGCTQKLRKFMTPGNVGGRFMFLQES